MTKLKAISGRKQDKAPSPSHGLIKAVYETVDALGGGTEKQVYKYLPAAILDSKQITTHKRLTKVLKSAVYRGYLIHDSGTDSYRVAPKSYYDARVKYVLSLKSTPKGYGRTMVKEEASVAPVKLPINLLLWSFAGGALWGLSIGIWIGVVA